MDYKEKYEELLAEKEQSEQEFGQKRAQFRQLYLDCENKLKEQKEITNQYEQQIRELSKQLDACKSENEGIQTAARISLETRQEDLNSLKRKHQEELASLQHIWEVGSQEKINTITKQFEDERNKLIQVNSKLEQRLKELKSDPDDSNKDGLMSLMSSAFSRKSSSLEIKQQQAQTDVDAWKSIVTPLEEEIAQLKKQLQDGKKNQPEGKDTLAGVQKVEEFREKLIETKKYLEAERSARGDLEMYVAVLNTQKGVLQEDADKLRRELHSVCNLLDQEKSNHKELKETWTLANEQFITTHNAMQHEIELMRGVLTSQQLENISKSLRKERSLVKSKANLAVKSEKQKSNECLINFDNVDKESIPSPQLLKKKSPAVATKTKTSLSGRLFDTLFPAARELNELLNEDKENCRNQNASLLSSSDSDDDIEQAIMKQNIHRYNIEKAQEEFGIENPIYDQSEKHLTTLKKSSSHGDIINIESSSEEYLQEKSLSQGDISWSNLIKNQDEESWSNQSIKNKDEESWSMQDSTITDEIESKISFNDKKWSEEISHMHQCMMCQNYEKQLQRLQKEFMSIKVVEGELDSEREKFTSLKKSMESAAADTSSQISIYQANQLEVNKQVELLYKQFLQFQDKICHEMKSLSEERDRYLAEMTSLKEQSGQAVRGNFSEQHQDATEHLKNEIMFLKDRLMAVQFDRENTEKLLEHDLHVAKKKIANFMAKSSSTPQEDHKS